MQKLLFIETPGGKLHFSCLARYKSEEIAPLVAHYIHPSFPFHFPFSFPLSVITFSNKTAPQVQKLIPQKLTGLLQKPE